MLAQPKRTPPKSALCKRAKPSKINRVLCDGNSSLSAVVVRFVKHPHIRSSVHIDVSFISKQSQRRLFGSFALVFVMSMTTTLLQKKRSSFVRFLKVLSMRTSAPVRYPMNVTLDFFSSFSSSTTNEQRTKQLNNDDPATEPSSTP